MKRIIFAVLAFFAIAMNASANGYCDGRGNPQAVNQCYVVNIQMQNSLVTQHYQQLSRSPKYTMKQKAELEINQLQWEQSVRQQCRVNACVEQSYVERNRALVAEINRTSR